MEPEIYELYYQIVFDVSRGVKQLITGIMLAMLCRHFIVSARARRRAWTVGAAYFAVMEAFLYIKVEVYSFTAYLTAFLTAFLVLYCLEKENRQVKFLLCYIFFSMRILASDVASELSYLLEMSAERWIILHSGMPQEDIWRAGLLSFGLFRAVECTVAALILWMISKGGVKIFFFSRNGMEKKEMLLLMLPSVLGIVYYIERVRNVNVILQKTGRYMNEMIPEYSIMEIVTQVILLAAIMSMLYLYQKLKQEQGEKQSDRLVLQEVRSMRAHIEEVERLHDDLRGMRHDMNNHISVLSGLMTRGQYEQAREYLDSMGRAYRGTTGRKPEPEYGGTVADRERAEYGGTGTDREGVEYGGTQSNVQDMECGGTRAAGQETGDGGTQSAEQDMECDGTQSNGRSMGDGKTRTSGQGMEHGGTRTNGQEPDILTGNPVTDLILAEHSRRISEAGAKLEADFHYPGSTTVNAFDLSVILDNALTNAREAVTQGGCIRIRSYREHNAYLVVVENTFAGELSGRGAEGLPMTTKQPPDEHGFGLRHIRTVVEHYHGAMTIEQIGDLVRLSVMLCV